MLKLMGQARNGVALSFSNIKHGVDTLVIQTYILINSISNSNLVPEHLLHLCCHSFSILGTNYKLHSPALVDFSAGGEERQA